jgi:hypothetical protein
MLSHVFLMVSCIENSLSKWVVRKVSENVSRMVRGLDGRKPAWMLGLLGFCPNIHLFSKASKPEL